MTPFRKLPPRPANDTEPDDPCPICTGTGCMVCEARGRVEAWLAVLLRELDGVPW